jgi:type II secretory ATPase GspE/PulE/Tfp pilus assembly ATPase PilB-like protein
MPPRIERIFKHCIKQASGITLVTGPTGSGKTTTLNAVVNEINDADINIISVEDPVEYHAHDYVNQSSLMPQAGYTYGRALRAIMRQDPDVILIGEVRDFETAEIAVQAALTGHRVFTTLHTEDSAGAVIRMVDIGVENFLVSTTLVSAINQRLIRKVCTLCAEEYIPAMDEMVELGIDEDVAAQILSNRLIYTIKKGRGCNACRNTGFKGRQGVFEILNVTPAVRTLIVNKQTSDVIAQKAREEDPGNLIFEEGIRLVLTGVTALDELKRLPRGDYKLKSVEGILQD